MKKGELSGKSTPAVVKENRRVSKRRRDHVGKPDFNVADVLIDRVEGLRANLYICVAFIISNLVAFFLLPERFKIYFMERQGELLNRYEITLFWIFMGGFVLSLHFMLLGLISEEIFSGKKLRKRVKTARELIKGAFCGGWLAMFYAQWDGVHFANTDRHLIDCIFPDLIPVLILGGTTAICGMYVLFLKKG